MMNNDDEIRAVADKFFAAIERGDSAAISECYAPEMRVWNNIQQIDVAGSDHITGLEEHLFGRFSDRKYVDVRTDLIEGGFVRQQVFTAWADGNPVRMPMCLVCRVKDGKLTRIDEYLALAPLPQS